MSHAPSYSLEKQFAPPISELKLLDSKLYNLVTAETVLAGWETRNDNDMASELDTYALSFSPTRYSET